MRGRFEGWDEGLSLLGYDGKGMKWEIERQDIRSHVVYLSVKGFGIVYKGKHGSKTRKSCRISLNRFASKQTPQIQIPSISNTLSSHRCAQIISKQGSVSIQYSNLAAGVYPTPNALLVMLDSTKQTNKYTQTPEMTCYHDLAHKFSQSKTLLHLELSISSHMRSFRDDKNETRAAASSLPNLQVMLA